MNKEECLTCWKVQGYVVAKVCEAAFRFGNIVGTMTEDLSIEFWERDAGLDHLLFSIGQHNRRPACSLGLAGKV